MSAASLLFVPFLAVAFPKQALQNTKQNKWLVISFSHVAIYIYESIGSGTSYSSRMTYAAYDCYKNDSCDCADLSLL